MKLVKLGERVINVFHVVYFKPLGIDRTKITFTDGDVLVVDLPFEDVMKAVNE